MASTRALLFCSLLAILLQTYHCSEVKSKPSLKSLLKSKDLNLDRVEKIELTEEELQTYVPLAIEQLESELIKSLLQSPPTAPTEHHRAKRTLLLLKKKKLIIAKLFILKALLGAGGAGAGLFHKRPQQGGYGYGPSMPSKYGPPPTPQPSYGPPPTPQPSYGPPPAPSYGPPPQQQSGYGG